MATEGREQLVNAELGNDLDAKGFKIINADLSESTNAEVDVPTIESTSFVLKGDGAGNAVAAGLLTDYWGNDDFKASGSLHDHGLVPDPGAVAGATKFLREDATWAVPAGTGTIPTIESTSVVLKGDGAGNAEAATADVDYWTTTVFAGNGVPGLVPDPAEVSTTKFLRADGTFEVPPASAGVTIEVTTAVIKGDGAGGGVAATAGTDFVAPSTALTRLLAATTALSGTTPTVNWNTTTTFSHTLSGNTTYTFSNSTDGYDITIAITNTASNYTVAWPAGIKWVGGSAPTQTIGVKTDIYGFKAVGGTPVIYGAYIQNLS